MRPSELQEDVQWLEELLAIRVRVGESHPKIGELNDEIAAVRARLAHHDYTVLQARIDAHFKEKGDHDCLVYTK